MPEMTPMMKQYIEIKRRNADCILFFRLGDFYEMFFEDAKTVSSELDLVLTGKDCGLDERAPMCGVPFHSADGYIARLVANGHKVAICEQTEDPALAKGLVRREVIRVVTPGTVIESNMLEEGKNNFLCSIFGNGKKIGVCFADVSTGQVHLTSFEGRDAESSTVNELALYLPSEFLLGGTAAELPKLKKYLSTRQNGFIDTADKDSCELSECTETVCRHFGIGAPRELDETITDEAVIALGVALNYLSRVQKCNLENIREVDYYGSRSYMQLDLATRRNLELTETMRSRDKRGSLLWVLDKTKTPMGKREIRSWIDMPLLNVTKIIKRHNAVDELFFDTATRESLSEALSGVYDLERLITRISFGTANGKELRALWATALQLPKIRLILSSCKSALLTALCDETDELSDIRLLIENSIVEDPPFSVREGGMIKEGFNPEVDRLRSLVNNGKGYIAGVQSREQERTGIKKLKIGYNRVFGYYIEVTNPYKELVPDDYIRKQTLSNCERYITQELKDLETQILGAQERIVQLEYEIFNEIRLKVANELARIQRTARAIAQIDVLCSFAGVALENGYVRPRMTDGTEIELFDARHPVVEKMLGGLPFVPNDTLLDCDKNRCAIITGPNMAGKSTYMRQVALITIMAQAGSFVPAKAASLCVADRVFTRVGASDDLSAGQSTFMVEMSEVADILRHATGKSLIVFDEIGRGTSTFDGMSIARAVLEFVADKKRIGAKTLFATHYHELTELEGQLDGVKNYNIAVKKRGDDITFLRRIVRGGADGSYGIEVAKLAGVPDGVVIRAREILKSLEQDGEVSPPHGKAPQSESSQMSFTVSASEMLLDRLRALDVNTLTPIESMKLLFELSQDAKAI